MRSSLSLSGKNLNNQNNLLGKCILKGQHVPSDVKKIKIFILNNLIIPILSRQWEKLHENLLLLEKIKKKIDYYYKIYNLEDLIIYKEMIKAVEIIICEHTEFTNLEKKLYNSSNDLSTVIYKTKTMIKLKPEYEIYDVIFNKPDKTKNEKYNETIIEDIERLLQYENIEFNKIKDYVTNKYNSILS